VGECRLVQSATVVGVCQRALPAVLPAFHVCCRLASMASCWTMQVLGMSPLDSQHLQQAKARVRTRTTESKCMLQVHIAGLKVTTAAGCTLLPQQVSAHPCCLRLVAVVTFRTTVHCMPGLLAWLHHCMNACNLALFPGILRMLARDSCPPTT
jgi:hypothetical protein